MSASNDRWRDVSSEVDSPELERIKRVAFWMDQRYLDPILGLLMPGAGDALGAAIGLLSVAAAYRMGAHPMLLARMLINLAVDAVIGAIPLVGAIADFFYRAHTRNLALLERRDLREARASDWFVVAGAGLLFVLALCLPIVLVAATLALLFSR